MKFLLPILLLLAPAALHAQASVLLKTEVSPKEILIGDPVQMTVTVVYSTGITPVAVQFSTGAGDFEILSSEASQPRAEKPGRSVMTHRLTLTTFSTGTVTLASLPIYFRNTDGSLAEARTDAVTITVKSLLAEKGDEGSLRPLKGLYNMPPLWPLWAAAGAAILALIIWIVVRMRSKRGSGGADAPEEPRLSPEEEAAQALAALELSTLIAEGQYKEFYSNLSSVLRRYVERRYAISASEMTSSELIAAFRQGSVPTEPAFACRAFLDNADLVKFARWTPGADEVSADIARLRRFVQDTTPVPQAEPEPAAEEALPL